MGGGTILILCLSLFLGIEQHVAQATNLVFFIPTSIVAIITNIKHKNIDFKTRNSNCYFWSWWCNSWSKNSELFRCSLSKKMFWCIFSSNCNLGNLFFGKKVYLHKKKT